MFICYNNPPPPPPPNSPRACVDTRTHARMQELWCNTTMGGDVCLWSSLRLRVHIWFTFLARWMHWHGCSLFFADDTARLGSTVHGLCEAVCRNNRSPSVKTRRGEVPQGGGQLPANTDGTFINNNLATDANQRVCVPPITSITISTTKHPPPPPTYLRSYPAFGCCYRVMWTLCRMDRVLLLLLLRLLLLRVLLLCVLPCVICACALTAETRGIFHMQERERERGREAGKTPASCGTDLQYSKKTGACVCCTGKRMTPPACVRYELRWAERSAAGTRFMLRTHSPKSRCCSVCWLKCYTTRHA